MVAGAGSSAHSSVPFSSPSVRTISSRTINQAISRAVRDFGSGRYCDPSGIREITFRVAGASFSQNFRNSVFSSIASSTLCRSDAGRGILQQLEFREIALDQRFLLLTAPSRYAFGSRTLICGSNSRAFRQAGHLLGFESFRSSKVKPQALQRAGMTTIRYPAASADRMAWRRSSSTSPRFKPSSRAIADTDCG